jgi:uncharacterized protein YjgD (DUF1641 family)
MERLEKVHEMIENFADIEEKTVLNELLRWLSDDEVSDFVEDFKRNWEID